MHHQAVMFGNLIANEIGILSKAWIQLSGHNSLATGYSNKSDILVASVNDIVFDATVVMV